MASEQGATSIPAWCNAIRAGNWLSHLLPPPVQLSSITWAGASAGDGVPRAWAPSSCPRGVLDALPATAAALSVRHRVASTQQPCHAASRGIPARRGASPPQPGTRSSVAAGPCRSRCGNAANRITVQAGPGLMTCFLGEFPGALCRQGSRPRPTGCSLPSQPWITPLHLSRLCLCISRGSRGSSSC